MEPGLIVVVMMSRQGSYSAVRLLIEAEYHSGNEHTSPASEVRLKVALILSTRFLSARE